MSSLDHQDQVYQIPDQPSPQLKAVLDYFDCLKTWDFEKITKLSTPYFTQKTLPASVHVPARSKSEDIENLHTLQDLLKGGPLETVIYDVNENKGKIWVHLMMKGVNLECILLFTFGTGKDENFFTNLAEFFDSKEFTDGSGRNGNARPEPGVVQPEAHANAASPNVQLSDAA